MKNKNIINVKHYKLLNIFKNISNKKKNEKLLYFLHLFSGKVIFSLTKEDSLKKILNILIQHEIFPEYINTLIEMNEHADYFYMTKELDNGFIDKKNNILFISTKDFSSVLIDNKYSDNIETRSSISSKNKLCELILNHPIIHIEHGIGRYQGLTTIKTSSIKSEYLVILYAEGDKLYVPVSYLHLVAPYTEKSIKEAPLHKLGGDEWNKEKQKISKIVYDHAAHLLDIYAKRKSTQGFSFKIYKKKYQFFCNDCSFITTVDQNKVIKSVLKDMSKSVPMDRLICGDVGFGKTEIAMRAAFISVSNKKQVAILVPTTLLAQQHYENFTTRFSNYPISINLMCRFQGEKEQNVITKNTQNGKINILIGTHKLLFKNIHWYNLGLLIIDEEHRFGVNHKEIIKKIYSNIDILTLTATPIPRTLNMTMTGMKDISIIERPPAHRLAIKTTIKEYNPLLIRKTILREILRGGQVYYIYNKVQNIINIANRLSLLVPEANIKIGHGKMNNIDLKKVMNEFYRNQFNVLVCTTIIESGVDVSRANTIIIENSDHFGLSQLHQLRGRIGRSHYQGYALFLVNNFNQITSDAKKRLEAIASVDNFGGGFSISNQDLEIRGVGELLGREQSGHIKNIGFSLYMKFLKNTVNLLKKGKSASIHSFFKKPLEIELYVSSLFPETYITNVDTRLFFYKKISKAKSEKEIEQIKYKIINQFGKLPECAENLMKIAKIRLIACEIGIKYIKCNNKIGIIEFSRFDSINTQYLLKKFQEQPNIWKMENSKKIKFLLNTQNDYFRLKWIIKFLMNLKKNNF